MPHAVHAIVGTEVSTKGLAAWSFAVADSLDQGFRIVFVTPAMLADIDELSGFGQKTASITGFESLSLGLERLLEQESRVGPIVYFETALRADSGWEAAAVWERGRIVFGPKRLERNRQRDSRADPNAPVSSALHAIGAWHLPGSDEFEALGLDRFAAMPK
jgi:hypothetical protein